MPFRLSVPAWLWWSLLGIAAVTASWVPLLWVGVTQDPDVSTSRVLFVAAAFLGLFVTGLPVFYAVSRWLAPLRVQRGILLVAAGHSFFLASFLIANLGLVLAGSWNVTMFALLCALALVMESLFLARK